MQHASYYSIIHAWHSVAQLVEALRYKPEGRGFDSLGVDSVSNRNEYQEYFLWGKHGHVMKCGSLKFLEPSGPLQGLLNLYHFHIQRDSKRLTQFRTSIFPELYMVCE